MKNYKSITRLAVCIVLTVLALCLCTIAQESTEQKIVCTYNKDSNTLQANIYVSSGTAIVGYCSLDYNENILTLLDKDGNAVPASVPNYAEDGETLYLKNIFESHNGVVITDIGNGTKKLINQSSGYAMFAWFYPDNNSFIDARENEVLIASLKFKLNSESSVSDINNSIVFAPSSITDTVSGWYPAIYVMDKDQNLYSYANGTLKADIIFELPSEDSSDTNSNNKEESESTTNKEEQDNTQTDTVPDKEEESTSDKTNTDENPDKTPDNESESDNNENTDDNTDNKPVVDENIPEKDEDKAENSDINTKVTVYDFGIKYESTETTLRLKWERPENIAIEYYTITLSDDNGTEIRKVDGIASVTGSYTLRDLAHSFTYVITLTAHAENNQKLVQDGFKAKTESFEGTPEAIICTVTYDAGDGYIYGFSEESVVFGKTAQKLPDVIAPDGLYFIGWSTDTKKPCDVSSIKLYSDVTYYAIYTDFPDAYTKGYISGYNDGSFKPEGTITRAESAALFARVLGYSEGGIQKNTFTDVRDSDWFEGVVSFCCENGYISGYEDGSFRPGNTITRAEFAAIVCRIFGFEATEESDHYSDISSHWAKSYANALYENCDTLPFGNNSFKPDRNITRREAVLVLSSALGRVPDKDSIIDYVRKNGKDGKIFTDISLSDPDFFEIADAAIGKQN